MNTLCLNEQLCFKLYALSRQLTSRYRPLLEELDLTYPQYLVMLVLWQEGQLTVKALGERLLLDSGTLTPLLKRLEQKQLINRQRDPADERSVIISLAKAGKALRQKAGRVPASLGRCISLTQAQQEALKSQLDDLLRALTTVDDIT